MMNLQGTLSTTTGVNGGLTNAGYDINATLQKQVTLEARLSNEVLRGYSAYDIAVLNGFEGTVDEWLESLNGKPIVMKQIGSALYWRYDNESDNQLRLLVDLSNQEKDYQLLQNKPKINGITLDGDIEYSNIVMVGHGLKYDKSMHKLEVDMADGVEKDNTLPVSSADVYTVVGNIEVLLDTI